MNNSGIFLLNDEEVYGDCYLYQKKENLETNS
jgi:hypothetical protein